jgi:beta-mannanase
MKAHPKQIVFHVLMAVVALGMLSSGPVPLALGMAPAAAPSAVAAFASPSNYIVEGAQIPPAPNYAAEISSFENGVGRPAGIVMYFLPWEYLHVTPQGQGPCDDNFLPLNVDGPNYPKPGKAGGHVIMITWEPLPSADPNSGIGNPGPAAYSNILSGRYDSLINACADELKAWSNKTFLIRFMHEMNNRDSAWWAGYSYNQKPDGTGDTDKFKQVWRYVWQKFHDRGVTNVEWVWSPNYASNPNVAWNDMNNYYPGDQYVDWIGLSGFNWMGAIPFQSYSYLYNAAVTDLQCRYAKPIVHAEIGSAPYSSGADVPPNEAAWIADTYQRVQSFPLVRAIVWFNDYAYHAVGQSDFRVWPNTNFGYNATPSGVSSSVTAAYAQAIGSSAFTSSFNPAALLNPPMTRCPGDSQSSNGVLSGRPAAAMVARSGATTAQFTVAAFGLGSSTNFTISGCPSGATCQFVSSGTSRSSSQSAPWSADTIRVTAGQGAQLGSFTLTVSGGGSSVQFQLTVLARVLQTFLPALRH